MKLTPQELLPSIFEKASLIKATFSNPQKKDPSKPAKIEIRPIKTKEKLLYQLTSFQKNQAFHKNLSPQDCLSTVLNEIIPAFKQGIISTTDKEYHLLSNKKGQITILVKQSSTKPLQLLSHNREKNYILSDNEPLPFLIELGIMNASGKIAAQKMNKFRQINRFLEMISDVLPHLKDLKSIHIVDFGCGKAYLTFALFHYLKNIKKLEVTVMGLDLKKEVIEYCQEVAQKIGYDQLHFKVGDIANYSPNEPVDMVVALHACDTATDVALQKAVQWKAKVILAAPCCQHELYDQVSSDALKPLLEHGILKERFAALATDAARAKILETVGYRTQVLEFIDSEHTPKNLMIRAILGNTPKEREKALKEFREFQKALSITPKLETLTS